MTQPIYLFVDLTVFFDVGITAGNVGFRLVVVEVAYKVMDGIVREKVLELGVLPLPVTPSSVCSLTPAFNPSVSCLIADG
jgi:hypothetical protein